MSSYLMSVSEITPQIIHIEMSNQSVLCRTFMRFEEYYESPYSNIKGQIFSREEFRKTYMEKRGASEFTYCKDWLGFNVPDYVFVPFLDGKFDPLLQCERKLLECVVKFSLRKDRYYVIGSVKGSARVLCHEISHGLWYTNKSYKKTQLRLLEGLSQRTRRSINQILLGLGYCEEVYDDEAVAFILTCSSHVGHLKIKRCRKKMREVFNEFSPWKLYE